MHSSTPKYFSFQSHQNVFPSRANFHNSALRRAEENATTEGETTTEPKKEKQKYQPPKYAINYRDGIGPDPLEKKYRRLRRVKVNKMWSGVMDEFLHQRGTHIEQTHERFVEDSRFRRKMIKETLEAEKGGLGSATYGRVQGALEQQRKTLTETKRLKMLELERQRSEARKEFLKAMAEDLHKWVYTPEELTYRRYCFTNPSFKVTGTNFESYVTSNRTPLIHPRNRPVK